MGIEILFFCWVVIIENLVYMIEIGIIEFDIVCGFEIQVYCVEGLFVLVIVDIVDILGIFDYYVLVIEYKGVIVVGMSQLQLVQFCCFWICDDWKLGLVVYCVIEIINQMKDMFVFNQNILVLIK